MREVAIVGSGMGNKMQMTLEAEEKIKHADCILCSARLVETVKAQSVPLYQAVTLEAVQQILDASTEQHIVILVSGDTGFYSAARNYKALQNCRIQFYPGVSSVAAFCAKLQMSWDDVRLLSLHGSHCNLV